MEKKWRVIVVERHRPHPLLAGIQHFDSSIDVVRELGETSWACIEEVTRLIGSSVYRGVGRVEMGFEALARIDESVLSDECRDLVELLLRFAKPGSVVVLEEVRG